MAIVAPECFLGLSQEDRRAQIYEALGGASECFAEATLLEQQKLILEAVGADTCIENTEDFYRAWATSLGIECVEDSDDAQRQIYAYYYTEAADDTLTDPACFLGLLPEQRLLAFFSTLLDVPPVSSYDPDAEAYFARVAAEGSDLSDPTKEAVNNFVVAAKVGEYWDKLKRVNLFCGADLIAALVPLKVETGGQNTDTAVNFVGGDYSEETGLTGDGSTKYLNTGFLPTSLTTNNTHFGVYNRSSVGYAGGDGCSNEGGRFMHYPPYSDGHYYADQYGPTPGNGERVSAEISAPYGFLMASRVAANDFAIYQNGVLLARNTNTNASVPTAMETYLFARHASFGSGLTGVPVEYHNYNYGAYSIGDGLTSSEIASYAAEMEAFQIALGRGVA
jgi:hypothetical protein